jgi:hypothetical protein
VKGQWFLGGGALPGTAYRRVRDSGLTKMALVDLDRLCTKTD